MKRALAFTSLGIGLTILGFSHDPVVALKIGAALLAITSAILLYKGTQAPRRDVKRTELWILLDRNVGLPAPQAQQILSRILRETYFRYAKVTGLAAAGFWTASLLYAVPAA